MHRDGRMNTAMALAGGLAACALVFVGCSASPDSSEIQGNALHLIGESGGGGCGGDDGGACATGGGSGHGETDAGSADGEPPADYRACQVDDDCVAVPQAGCCHNGWKTAVNREEVDAYDKAYACTGSHPICPLYIVDDTRVAECNRVSLLCEMVPIDQIACGGFVMHPHECPGDYACTLGRIPDIPGHCVADGNN
jgi:hypothetical protein